MSKKKKKEQKTEDAPSDLAPLEVSVLGVKGKAQSSAEAHAGPKSLSELSRRVIEHVYQVLELPFAIPAVAGRAAVNVIAGVGGYFVRPPKAEFEDVAEKLESQKQEQAELPRIEAEASDTQEPNSEPNKLEAAQQELAQQINHFREMGLTVEISDLGDGRIGLIIVPPEMRDTAAEVLEQKTIPQVDEEATLDESSSVLDRTCAHLDLPLLALGALQKLNVHKVRQLVRLSAEDLLAVEGFGESSLGDVRRELMVLGLKLSCD